MANEVKVAIVVMDPGGVWKASFMRRAATDCDYGLERLSLLDVLRGEQD
jgi:hypothetical protein